jgi:hypothetical protein
MVPAATHPRASWLVQAELVVGALAVSMALVETPAQPA